jgi:hypothetical protein
MSKYKIVEVCRYCADLVKEKDGSLSFYCPELDKDVDPSTIDLNCPLEDYMKEGKE